MFFVHRCRLSYVKARGFDVVAQPFAAGDVSFHNGWMLHRADGNATDRCRDAHTMQCVPCKTCTSHVRVHVTHALS
jgi:ectoine hydroxylase-related dioxygenase (phytanoyl-CoA dioxygenase family)